MGRSVADHVLFEVSTEVANRVGGIYSVLKSKAPVTASEYDYSRYVAIGRTNLQHQNLEVEQLSTEGLPALHRTLMAMQERGVRYLYGRWLIEGAPRVLLFDMPTGLQWLNEWKTDLWNTAGIPLPENDFETNDAVVFGYLVAWFVGEFAAQERDRAIVLHCHEWLAGVAIPLCRHRHIDCTTIFTTHATILGRYLCAGSVDFYNNLQYFDVDQEAGKRGIYHRYCIERAATHTADVFTTVSNITAYESEHLLKRKPDGVLPNGMNVVKFQAMHEFQNLHAVAKEKINEFVRGHFYGHYDFDLENTLYFFVAGRYEFRNKGIDMFLEALARLNYRLQTENPKMTVVAFLIMPAPNHSYTSETLKGQAVMRSLQETVETIQRNVGRRLFERAARYSGEPNTELPDPSELLTGQEKILLKRRAYGLIRHAQPPVVTHNMVNDQEDPVLNQIRRIHLFNNREDRVKVIFHPEFLNSSNPILPLDYDEFVRGCHLGVFPSYYEPWGYTPAECTVMGIPSITTNLSGFGCYMEDLIENPTDYGIYIIDRRSSSVDESVNQLADTMFRFTKRTRRQRINQRNRCERLSEFLDWKIMGLEYVKARQLALHRAYPDSFSQEDVNGILPNSFKVPPPLSAPASPRYGNGMMTPGDMATLQEDLQGLSTEDYHGYRLGNTEEDDGEQEWKLPLRLKRPGSGPGTPLGGQSPNPR